MDVPEPAATGTLRTRPLVDLLIYGLDRALDGSLVLIDPAGGEHALLFTDGGPSKVQTELPAIHLGEVLVDLGLLTEEQRERSFEVVQLTGRLHGEVLRDVKLLDDHAIHRGLREQTVRKVLSLLTLPPSTIFRYYVGADLLTATRGAPVRCRPLNLVWRAIKVRPDAAHVDAYLARLGDRLLKFHPRAPLHHFGFGTKERALVDILRARPRSLPELLGDGIGTEHDVRMLVFALFVTRQFDLGRQGKDPVGVREQRSVPPPAYAAAGGARFRPTLGQEAGLLGGAAIPREPGAPVLTTQQLQEFEALRKEIEERSENPGRTHYEVLGIEPGSPGRLLQPAFFQLAKRMHPDKLPPELSDMRPLATKVFARISEAHRVLADADQRKAYDQALQTGGDTEEEREKVQRVLHAATCFQKAEILLKRQAIAEALVEAETAVREDPTQAEYGALYAWILSQGPNPDLAYAVRELDSAVEREPRNVRVRWYRAQVLKRMGEADRAVRDFRAILDLQPGHVDALREMRLYARRTVDGSGGRGTGDHKRTKQIKTDPAPKGTGWFKRR